MKMTQVMNFLYVCGLTVVIAFSQPVLVNAAGVSPVQQLQGSLSGAKRFASPGNSYSCDSFTGICKCEGSADCRKMTRSKNCKKMPSCSNAPGRKAICMCIWDE